MVDARRMIRRRRGGRGHVLHARARKAGDQAGPALEGEVIPGPVQDDRQPVAESDQKIDVRTRPEEPSDEAGKPQPPHLNDRALPTDRRAELIGPAPSIAARRGASSDIAPRPRPRSRALRPSLLAIEPWLNASPRKGLKFQIFLARFRSKRQAVDISQQIERDVFVYLITITIMNALVGAATGLAMRWIGVGDPVLWGTVAFILNFVPILGPI